MWSSLGRLLKSWSPSWLSGVNTSLQKPLIEMALERWVVCCCLEYFTVVFEGAVWMLVAFECRLRAFPEPLLAPGTICWLCPASPQINNPPSWQHARFCLKQSVLMPLSSMPGQSKGRGRQAELRSCPPNTSGGPVRRTGTQSTA